MKQPDHPQVKANNFDLIRIVAAICVLFWHAYLVTGHAGSEPLLRLTHGQMHFGWIGLPAFFFASGFLLYLSWERDPNSVRFVVNRILRIVPGLAVAVIISVFILGPAVSSYPLGTYFSVRATYAYLLNIKLFPLRDILPGCFLSNPYPAAVNGSLWTIPYEAVCYLCFVLLAVGGITRRNAIPLALWLATACLLVGAYDAGQIRDLPFEFLGLGTIQWLYFSSLFWAGAFFSQYRARIPRSAPLLMTAVLLLAISNRYGCLTDCSLFVLPYIVFFAAHVPIPESLRKGVTRWGDLSYGVYLSAFPIQQALAQYLPFCRWPVANALVATVASGLYAVISWRFVESRMLRLKTARILHRARLDRCTTGDAEAAKGGAAVARVALSVVLCAGLAAVVCRPSPLPPEALYGDQPFAGELGGQWLPYVPGEGHRWMAQAASVKLRQGVGSDRLTIRAYVPGNFPEVTRLTIFLDDKVVLGLSRKAKDGGWLIADSISVEKTYDLKIRRIALVFNASHAPAGADLDRRDLAALVDLISLE